MLSLFFGLFLAILSLLSAILQKVYTQNPLKALKHQARAGDKKASALYRPAAYGEDLQLLIWLVITLSVAGSAVLLKTALTTWVAFLLVLLLVWLSFIWIPMSRSSLLSQYLAKYLAIPIAWIMHYAQPLLRSINHIVHRFYAPNEHSGIYDKTDLIELLEWQKEQPDNQILTADLTTAVSALSFGDKLVSSILVPARVVRSVSTHETISPILIDELHQTGHKCFPVYEGKSSNIIGTLYLKDLINNAKKSSPISSIIKRDVHYVHEDFTLRQALKAFYTSKHHLFIVVNEFEEFVGILTIEDILNQIIGKPLIDEFDQYDDLRAVASRMAQKEHTSHQKSNTEVKEVVE